MEIDHDLIERFKQWVFSDFSEETARSYSFYVASFCLGKTIDEVNSYQFFLDLKIKSHEKGLALNTIGNYVIGCKKFLKYMESFYGIETINLEKITCQRPPQKQVDFLEKEELRKIQGLPINDLFNMTDRTLFEFYLHTGCRVSEGLGLNWRDVNFDKGEVEVVGKGNITRTVFLGGSSPWLRNYLSERNNTASPLFLNHYGQRLSKKVVFLKIRRLGVKAGISSRLGQPIYPHLLRATFCTYLIRNKVDPKTVQYLMGHKDLETTLRYYYGVTKEDMKEAHLGLQQYLGALV